ncbi:MAG TPA: RNA-directed DNA polymerase [Puia sp.]|jgi:retron-type reverse transcriptase|nr:RNA-directed DNA polymerase [Puia sp.]
MKRIGQLYEKICSLDNLRLADQKARKGKSHQPGVKAHLVSAESNLLSLQQMLLTKTYQTSPYITFKIYEPKEREIFRLPYFPDRILHHAVLNILEPIFRAVYTADSYSCIRGRGIHGAARAVKRALRDPEATRYCLKLDIRKFYPSVSHNVLKGLLRRKFKDPDLLWLLDEIIESAPGLPIGNYLSQYFANFYLTYFDHWLKEEKLVRHYFRYLDDMVFLAPNKPSLHRLLGEIRQYLEVHLRLQLKANYQVFPVAARGIDFVGYRFFLTHTLLRKSIKKNFARMVARRLTLQSVASYYGWAAHADCNHLLKTLLHEKFQGIRDQAGPERIRGRQNQDRQDPQPVNHGRSLQDREIQVRRRSPGLADPDRGDAARHFYRISDAAGDDRTGAKGSLPLPDNDRKRERTL